jgi:hypothetical protein
MELLFQIDADPQTADLLNFLSGWPEAGSIQEVDDLLLPG